MLAVILLSGLVLWINQKVAIQRLRNNFPASGRLVNVYGHQMHLNCSGSKLAPKTPTILINVPEGSNPFQTRRVPVEPRAITQQATLANLSTRGRQHIASNSGHLMQHDAPEAILAAIQELAPPKPS